jgi:hypothetical protein
MCRAARPPPGRSAQTITVGAEVHATNRVTQLAMVAGAFAVAAIVGIGALSRAEQPRPTPRPVAGTASAPVTFTTPAGWFVVEHDGVVTLGRAPTQSNHSIATITVCQDAYAVRADGSLANDLKTGATTIAFSLAQRADLRTVIKARRAAVGGYSGYYLDFTITPSSDVGNDRDTWVLRSQLATCLVMFDTAEKKSEEVPAGIQVTVPTITRLGLFDVPGGGNVLVLMTSQGIGSRGLPDKADIEEATGIVEGFTFHLAPAQ